MKIDDTLDELVQKLLKVTEDSIQNKASQLEHALNLYAISRSNEDLFQAVKNEWLEWKKKPKTGEKEIDYLSNIREQINSFCKEKGMDMPGFDFQMWIISLPLDVEPGAFNRPRSAPGGHCKTHMTNDTFRSESVPAPSLRGNDPGSQAQGPSSDALGRLCRTFT
jgi:hypothetical protein